MGGPAGQFNYNIMCSVAQYHSDNLRYERLKGMNERAEQVAADPCSVRLRQRRA